MSVLEYMQKKTRKNLSPTVKVLFPSREPELEIEITRIPQTMARHAMNRGFMVAAIEGLSSNAACVVERAEAMLPKLQQHIIGWKVLREEWPEFSRKDSDELIENLDTPLMLDFVAAYDMACIEDEDNSGNGLNLDLEKPSESDSKSG